jgi:hypothetical protein
MDLHLLVALALAAVAWTLDAARATDPRAVTGHYKLLGQAPIAAAHHMQLPCGHDQFLLMGEPPAVVKISPTQASAAAA